jgi:formylmethanofuran dehydrogenase subunit C
MPIIKLSPKYSFKVPVNAQIITPDIFQGKTPEEIAKLQVWEGNRSKELGELFKISENGNDALETLVIEISGDLKKVRRIGAKMSIGEIVIHGDVGMHLGEEMEGGKITVNGNAESWMGAMMRGGIIEVKGNTGNYVASAYRGSTKGMRGGKIIIHGNAGNDVGNAMLGGVIKIFGNVGQFVGVNMHDGTIMIRGDCQGRMGAEMRGGKIVICGHVKSVLPSFTIEALRKRVKVEGEPIEGPFYLFLGDLNAGGNGKLFISKNANQHLSFYEKFL